MPIRSKCSDTFANQMLERYDKDILIGQKPRMSRALGSEKAGLFLHQALFRFRTNDFKPFYKFNGQCNHLAYRDGDSWREELWLSKYEFIEARATVATRLTDTVHAKSVFDVTDPEWNNGVMSNASSLMVYWTDKNGLTWYNFNWRLFLNMLKTVYPEAMETASEANGGSVPKTDAPPTIFGDPDEQNQISSNYSSNTEVTQSISSAILAACPGRKENEPLTDWFSRTWREGEHKERAEALDSIYRFLFGTDPNFGRLFKMVKDLNSGKALFDLMLDAGKVQLTDDPQTFLQGMVNNRKKKGNSSPSVPVAQMPSQHDILFGKS